MPFENKLLIKVGLTRIAIGFITFFVLYALLNQSTNPLSSYLASLIGGVFGIFIASYWIEKRLKYKLITLLFILAFVFRTLVGIGLYLYVTDPNYFEGKGKYKINNPEFSNNYDNALTAASSIRNDHIINPFKIFPPLKQVKDLVTNTWMGVFFATGNSKNVMDLSNFNSFHHVIAGIFIILIGILLNLDTKNTIIAGILTAWIPWSFPGSIIWRDSVGIAFILASFFFLLYAIQSNVFKRIIFFFISFVLAWSVRTIYGFLIIIAFPIIWYISKHGIKSWKLLSIILLFVILFSIIFSTIIENLFFFNYTGKVIQSIPDRILSFPLLITRGIFGPFPWHIRVDNIYVFFDYLYHVFQLMIFYLFIKKNRFKELTQHPLFILFLIFWISGIIAPGIHTAYLAIMLPLLLLISPLKQSQLSLYFIFFFLIFLIFNSLYFLGGFEGSGLILKSTGY